MNAHVSFVAYQEAAHAALIAHGRLMNAIPSGGDYSRLSVEAARARTAMEDAGRVHLAALSGAALGRVA